MQKSSLFERVEMILGIDKRALGLFRISLGLILLTDLCVRSQSLVAHYTDSGVIPRDVLVNISENALVLSLNMLGGSLVWQVVLLGVTIVCAISFLVGYRTRLATIFCWLLMLSWNARNPFVNNLGDWLLLDLLLWGSLLPLGLKYSVDSAIGKECDRYPAYILTLASMGILIQILAVYFFSTFFKISPIWHTEGTAIQYALSLDRLVTPVGEAMKGLPAAWLQLLTFFVLFLEKWGPLLCFVPIFIQPTRIVVAGCFILFHVGLAVTFNLGIFPYICISAWLLFLPKIFWDKVASAIKATQQWIGVSYNGLPNETGVRSSRRAVYPSNFLEMLVAVLLLGVIFSSNMEHIGRMDTGYYEKVYKYAEPLVNALHLRQRWNMFSPHPSKRDGWFVVVGELSDGRLVDVFNEGVVSWERPGSIASTYKNQRWRKNLEWVMIRWDIHAGLLGTYMLKEWNASSTEEEKIVCVSVYLMAESASGPALSTKIERRLLHVSRIGSEAGC